MRKKENEPEYISSPFNTPLLNYRVYYMSKLEKIRITLFAVIAGGTAGLIFYGGQFRDAEGMATMATRIGNVVIFLVTGLIVACFFLPVRKKQLKIKRKRELTRQFRELLSAISTSLSSGMNMQEALQSAYRDLCLQYPPDAYIIKETSQMLEGMRNGLLLEDMMKSLGERSEIEDIRNFGIVFALCYRTGGNLREIVQRTSQIIGEKLEITEEIETMLTSNKMQFTCMMGIPIIMVLMLRMMSGSFAESFSTPAGITGMSVALVIFAIAYKLGQKIMDVKG